MNTAKTLLLVCATVWCSQSVGSAATILFESGTLGTTGHLRGDVTAANVNPAVFNGVRFQLTQPVVTSQIGGHFVGSLGTTDTFFGAVVKLDDENDFPDSTDLSTADVLGHALIAFPESSAEVFANLELELSPGWYSLVFGSGLFGASGSGVMPLNNPDIGTPVYIGYQPGVQWFNLIDISNAFVFEDYRMVVQGRVVPEPAALILAATAVVFWSCSRRFIGYSA